jgi:short-subunit dehydrogenase
MRRRLKSLSNRSILITGASSGIGRAVAEQAAAGGARIALVALQQDELDRTAERVRALGGEAHVIACDVADRAAALAAVERAEDLLGGIDVAVINAGIGRHRMLIEHDLEEAEHIIRVNVLGALYFAHALAPRMLSRGEGWLVFVSSIGGLLPLPGEPVYSASKFALVGLSESLSIELDPTVHVLTLCPGMVDHTNFLHDDEHDRVTAAARRLAVTPEQVAHAMFVGLARGKRRVVVPARLGLVARLRGLWPSIVRRGTARELAPILGPVQRALAPQAGSQHRVLASAP